MKAFIITLALILPTLAMGASEGAQGRETYYANDKAVSKVEALMSLARDPKTKVVKCVQQELSSKATLRNVKKSAE